MHILVVDPNEAFATLLSEELKRHGYNVETCFDGDGAMKCARRRRPDLALLDMALESPDALMLAQRLREIDGAIRLMLIPLMGEDLSTRAKSVPVQGVLPKPFFLPELPERIDAALKAPIEALGAIPAAAAAPPPQVAQDVDLAELFGPDALFDVPAGEVFDPLAGPMPEAPPAPSVVKEAAPPAAPPAEDEPGPISVTAAAPLPEIPDDGGLSYDAFTANRTDVRRAMSNLAQEVGADIVLLTMGEELIAWVGQLGQEEAVAVAQAAVQGWRTSAEVARILGREQARFEQSIAGDDYMLYALSVESNAIMAVAIRGSAPLGLLRHRARGTAEQITRLCTG